MHVPVDIAGRHACRCHVFCGFDCCDGRSVLGRGTRAGHLRLAEGAESVRYRRLGDSVAFCESSGADVREGRPIVLVLSSEQARGSRRGELPWPGCAWDDGSRHGRGSAERLSRRCGLRVLRGAGRECAWRARRARVAGGHVADLIREVYAHFVLRSCVPGLSRWLKRVVGGQKIQAKVFFILAGLLCTVPASDCRLLAYQTCACRLPPGSAARGGCLSGASLAVSAECARGGGRASASPGGRRRNGLGCSGWRARARPDGCRADRRWVGLRGSVVLGRIGDGRGWGGRRAHATRRERSARAVGSFGESLRRRRGRGRRAGASGSRADRVHVQNGG